MLTALGSDGSDRSLILLIMVTNPSTAVMLTLSSIKFRTFLLEPFQTQLLIGLGEIQNVISHAAARH